MFDEDDATLDAIKSGTIDATVVQKPSQFGYLSAKWMHELATKKEETKKALPPSGVIDTGNRARPIFGLTDAEVSDPARYVEQLFDQVLEHRKAS